VAASGVDVGAWPARFRDPAPGPRIVERLRGNRALQPDAIFGSSMMPVSTPFSICPQRRLLQEADARPGLAMRIFIAQGPTNPFAGQFTMASMRETVLNSHRPNRPRDRPGRRSPPSLADRAVFPEFIAPLVLQPLATSSGCFLRRFSQTSRQLSPSSAIVRRARHIGQHDDDHADWSFNRQPP